MSGPKSLNAAKGRVGIAPARFGLGISGGAEIVLAEMARGLDERGWEVEILTTCARDGYSWRNELEPGVSQESGVLVRRFPAVVSTSGAERGAIEQAMQAGVHPALAEQQRWMNDGVRMPALYHYLLDHAGDYQTLVFGPYPFWMTFACSQIAPDRSVLWTCLHDEPYAYLELFEPVLTGVAGLFFQSEPEHQLAHRVCDRLGRHDTVGCPVGSKPGAHYDGDRFRLKFGIKDPFVLYLGRREGAKGWPDLMRTFATAYQRLELPLLLVTAGGGEPDIPAYLSDRVIDVGFLSDADRDDALAAAAALVQPSRYEAFSRTVMEAWLAGTLVIVNGDCDVLSWHCDRSGAGLTYHDSTELEQCLHFVAEAPEAAAALAEPGRGYVLSNYGRETVLDRIEQDLIAWTARGDGEVGST